MSPEAFVMTRPRVDLTQRGGVEPIKPVPTRFATLDKPGLVQNPEVLRHSGVRKASRSGEVTHCRLAGRHRVKQRSAVGVGNRPEDVGRRGDSRHIQTLQCLLKCCQPICGSGAPIEDSRDVRAWT
jgi:hypothetical protein